VAGRDNSYKLAELCLTSQLVNRVLNDQCTNKQVILVGVTGYEPFQACSIFMHVGLSIFS
jgi:hypothetical protein